MAGKEYLPSMRLQDTSKFFDDMRRRGWNLIRNVPITGNPAIELTQIFQEDEEWINGEEFLARSANIVPIAGQLHGERILMMERYFRLDDHLVIPKEWENIHVAFPGTIWSEGNRLFVYYIEFTPQHWRGGFLSLDQGVFDCVRVASLRPPTKVTLDSWTMNPLSKKLQLTS